MRCARASALRRRGATRLAATMRHLSVAPDDSRPASSGCRARTRRCSATLRVAQEQLAVHEARALVARGTRAGDRLVIVEALRRLGCGGAEGAGRGRGRRAGSGRRAVHATAPALVVVARHPAAGLDAGATLKALVAQFGGKGGGKPDLAQGGGLNASSDALVTAARKLLGESNFRLQALGSGSRQLDPRPKTQTSVSSRARASSLSPTSAPCAARRRGGSPRRSASRSR